MRRVWTEAWVYACVDGCARLALRSRPEAPVPGRVGVLPFGGVRHSGRTKRRASKTRPPQSTAVSELERTKGTRLLNRNIA